MLSEQILQCELNLSRIERLVGQWERRSQRKAPTGSGAVGGMVSEKTVVISAKQEVGVIEDVEELRDEFDSGTLLEFEDTSDAEIVAVEPRSQEYISPQPGCSVVGEITIAIGVVGRLAIDWPARTQRGDCPELPPVE